MADDKDYLIVLRALDDIPFSVGRKLLVDYLRGGDHESVSRNRLDRLKTFGALELYLESELIELIETLVSRGFIGYSEVPGKRYWKVLALTAKGRKEMNEPTLKRLRYDTLETVITEKEEGIFRDMGFYLDRYNDFQKKAIVSDRKSLLCIAGAGTGKTTVLTSRIDFLIRFRSVQPKRILAVTFTRKARMEMKERLKEAPPGINIETFNSFCERYLSYYGDLVYGRPVRVIRFSERIRLFMKSIEACGKDLDQAISIYFTDAQRRIKTRDQLQFMLLNDCFSILDLFKSDQMDISKWDPSCSQGERAAVDLMRSICSFIDRSMKKAGLRDYSDQLLDCFSFFDKNPEYVPVFDHVLIDEYQDVNRMQIALLDLLKPKNIFAVGDPRQSIFGWRGSKIGYILDFASRYPDSETVTLVRNYRSNTHIVDLINRSIRHMRLPDLKSEIVGKRKIRLHQLGTEDEEMEFISEEIEKATYPREEIFVLARTNRQLSSLSKKLVGGGIPHVVRSDEERKPVAAMPGEVTLATIHAIKGLEAKFVILMGVTPSNFPCKSSDHPIIDLVKTAEYDKDEEERRLFYVALSRAREEILMTYAGNALTWFINNEMKSLIETIELEEGTVPQKRTGDLFTDLRVWRASLAKKLGIPAYMILHDSALSEIVSSMPVSTFDLEGITGLGKEKVRRYGADILSIVNRG